MTSCEGCGSDDGPTDKWKWNVVNGWRKVWLCPNCEWCSYCRGSGEMKELTGATDFYFGPCENCDGKGAYPKYGESS